MDLTVSVALCTHNGAAYIQEQLRSIFAQTAPPTEVVISDDASTDGTVVVIQAFLQGAEAEFVGVSIAVSLLQNPVALGVTANFEQALRACHGELLALCDQDDVWYPHRLEDAAALFEKSPELLLLSSNARLVDAAGDPIGYSLFDGLGISRAERAEVHAGKAFQALLRRNLATGATTLLRRQLVERATPFPEPWVHDEWLTVVAAAIGRFEMLEKELIDYRQHDRNQIGVRRRGLLGKMERVLEPRGDRYRYLVTRTEVLLRRLELLGDLVQPVFIDELRGKLAHLQFRVGLPNGRPGRILPVLREARTGRYGRYSRGMGDILRDLLQPK